MQNPLFSQLGQKVLENTPGRPREPKPPEARGLGERPTVPYHTEAFTGVGRPRGGREGQLCWIQRVPTPPHPPDPVPEVLLDGLQLAHPLRSIRDTILSCLPWGREEGTGLRAGASPSHICMRTQPRRRTGLGWHAPSSGASFTCTCMRKDPEQRCPVEPPAMEERAPLHTAQQGGWNLRSGGS